jgi:hypothetical protein
MVTISLNFKSRIFKGDAVLSSRHEINSHYITQKKTCALTDSPSFCSVLLLFQILEYRHVFERLIFCLHIKILCCFLVARLESIHRFYSLTSIPSSLYYSSLYVIICFVIFPLHINMFLKIAFTLQAQLPACYNFSSRTQ